MFLPFSALQIIGLQPRVPKIFLIMRIFFFLTEDQTNFGTKVQCCFVWFIIYLMRNIINVYLRSFHFSNNIIVNFTHIALPPKEVQMCIHKSTFSCYLTVWWVVNNVFNELIKVWNTVFYLNKIKIFDFPYFRRKLWCIQFFKKNSDFFFLISALASKKWSNRKSQCTLIYWL